VGQSLQAAVHRIHRGRGNVVLFHDPELLDKEQEEKEGTTDMPQHEEQPATSDDNG
jgi:hypothetical protein